MESLERKELKYSKKVIIQSVLILLCIGLFVALVPMFAMGEFNLEYFLEPEILSFILIFAATTIGFTVVALYQHQNNVLEYGNYGFVFKDVTYSYKQVTKLLAVHRGKYGTYYHVYVGDEVVYKFSTSYENKDDFIMVLQKNGVPIIA